VLDLLRHGSGAEPWTPTGEVARARLEGAELLLAVERDPQEEERRRRVGLGVITSRRVLEFVLTLPRGVAIPRSFLREEDLRLIYALPRGVVDVSDAEVKIRLMPVISLLSVGVVARSWRAGLRSSSSYAAYCARYVVLDRARSDTQMAAMEARYLGVGLAVRRDRGLDWLVSPAPFPSDRFTASSWLMAERVAGTLA
jgi:hypothetical protein